MEASNPIISGYNTRLERWIISEANFWFRRKYFEFFRERHLPAAQEIPQSWEIIDAGCFTGSKIEALIQRYPERIIRWIDINDKALGVARERFTSGQVSFELGDIRSLQTKVRDAAMVFSSQVFHHLDEDERWQALEAIYASLQSEGKFVISDTFLDKETLLGRFLIWFYSRIAKSPYHNVLPKIIIQEAEKVGFTTVSQHHTFPGQVWSHLMSFYPSSMLTFVK